MGGGVQFLARWKVDGLQGFAALCVAAGIYGCHESLALLYHDIMATYLNMHLGI